MIRSTTAWPILLTAALAVASGCVSTGGSVSMDSNSPMPWFGFGLAPRERKTEQHREIRSDARESFRAEPIPLSESHRKGGRSGPDLKPAPTREKSWWLPNFELPRRIQSPLQDDESIPVEF